MPRALDHLVIPARDLSAQAELYRRLGFQVGARNRHPWGTENHIVQFDDAFLELIGLGEDFAPPPPAPRSFSFAGFVAQYLARREGLAMLVLRSRDASADRDSFAARGLGDFERFDFARKAKRPDGSLVDVAFSLAFAQSAALPATGFFVCQQHFPENFWNRAAQVHPNGALGVASLMCVHPEPSDASAFLSDFLAAPSRAIEGGLAFEIDAARVECVTPAADRARIGEGARDEERQGLAAMEIRVAELARVEAILRANGVAFSCRAASLVVAPDTAMGVRIEFAEIARPPRPV